MFSRYFLTVLCVFYAFRITIQQSSAVPSSITTPADDKPLVDPDTTQTGYSEAVYVNGTQTIIHCPSNQYTFTNPLQVKSEGARTYYLPKGWKTFAECKSDCAAMEECYLVLHTHSKNCYLLTTNLRQGCRFHATGHFGDFTETCGLFRPCTSARKVCTSLDCNLSLIHKTYCETKDAAQATSKCSNSVPPDIAPGTVDDAVDDTNTDAIYVRQNGSVAIECPRNQYSFGDKVVLTSGDFREYYIPKGKKSFVECQRECGSIADCFAALISNGGKCYLLTTSLKEGCRFHASGHFGYAVEKCNLFKPCYGFYKICTTLQCRLNSIHKNYCASRNAQSAVANCKA